MQMLVGQPIILKNITETIKFLQRVVFEAENNTFLVPLILTITNTGDIVLLMAKTTQRWIKIH